MADEVKGNDNARAPPNVVVSANADRQGADRFDIDTFSLVGPLGEGGHGVVWRAYNAYTGKHVAIKRLKSPKDTPALAIRLLREAKILRLLRGHQDIVYFHRFLTPPNPESFCDMLLVFEGMPKSLREILRRKNRLNPTEIKAIMFQLVRGVRFMHESGVVHRDLKPENVLVDAKTAKIKICDFGLSRVAFEPHPTVTWADVQLWTSKVATLQYRPPELLMIKANQTFYNSAVDIWSMGCIFGEMLLGRPMFHGEDESAMMFSILGVTGIPSEDMITRIQSTEVRKLIKKHGESISMFGFSRFPEDTDKDALRLVQSMLRFDPKERPSADEILNDEYFSTWLESKGIGPPPITIDKAQFAFDKTLGDESMAYREALHEELTYEVMQSMDEKERDVPVEVRARRSEKLVWEMDGKPKLDIRPYTEIDPSRDRLGSQALFKQGDGVASEVHETKPQLH